MDKAPEGGEPPNLRFLRRLVTLLTAVMIVGLLTIVALFVIRLNQPPRFPGLIERLPVNDPEALLAIGEAEGLLIIEMRDGRVLLLDSETLETRREIPAAE